MLLSVVIPAYNEKETIRKIISKVEAADIGSVGKEIIVVDDFSADGTREILRSFPQNKYKIHYQPENKGKGAALRKGFEMSAGDFIIVQDADLEYDPSEYGLLLGPLTEGKADVVYGSRFMGAAPHRVLFFWHYVGNRLLTTFSNMLTNLNLSDVETCYKVFNRDALNKILPLLRSNRFGIEVELTARIAAAKLRIYEVGISYSGRTYEEGKKINWKDGIAAIWFIIRYNIFSK